MAKENSAIRSGVADLLQDNSQHADHTQPPRKTRFSSAPAGRYQSTNIRQPSTWGEFFAAKTDELAAETGSIVNGVIDMV